MVAQKFILTSAMAATVMAGTMGEKPIIFGCGTPQPPEEAMNYRSSNTNPGLRKRQTPPTSGNSSVVTLGIHYIVCCPGGKCQASEAQLDKQTELTNEHFKGSGIKLEKKQKATPMDGNCDNISIQSPETSTGGPQGPIGPGGGPGVTGGSGDPGLGRRQIVDPDGNGLGPDGNGLGPGGNGLGPGGNGLGPGGNGLGPGGPSRGSSPWMDVINQYRQGDVDTIQMLIVGKQSGNTRGVCMLPMPNQGIDPNNDGCAVDVTALPVIEDNSLVGRVKRLVGRATTGTSDSRIATHEIAHGLGLPHPFTEGLGEKDLNRRQLGGQGGPPTCSNNDHFSDTEPQAGPTIGCPDEDGGANPGGPGGPGGPRGGQARRLFGRAMGVLFNRQAKSTNGNEKTEQDGTGEKVDAGTGEQVGGCVRGANQHNVMDYSTCSVKGFSPQQSKHMNAVAKYRLGEEDTMPVFPVVTSQRSMQLESPAGSKPQGSDGSTKTPKSSPTSKKPNPLGGGSQDPTGGSQGSDGSTKTPKSSPTSKKPNPLGGGSQGPTGGSQGSDGSTKTPKSSPTSKKPNPLGGDSQGTAGGSQGSDRSLQVPGRPPIPDQDPDTNQGVNFPPSLNSPPQPKFPDSSSESGGSQNIPVPPVEIGGGED
ncbi:hypothetical protein HRG_008152 [Hirsutella rhossiliensis]|uniref:Metalloprotease n=1 Tax=Hirsutella rhossiliensis TaxID=111463 RepID=A0A9P8MTQ9_9HYPO|nr:uncharacterized protein HRG_08152 [Hirsutella rhossiliensis]KAH0960999.1 hypothetical protein HRG_08152 [Hirsutella rhossiliensis]